MKLLDDPALDRAATLVRWQTKDPANDGAFLVGVLSTGIYCLPSCGARKPKDENVRFFLDEEGARRGGLRACKRCRPDRFYRGHDPDRECLERVVERVRRAPGEFAGTADLRDAVGVGATKLNELFRRHYHATPAATLQRARLDAAARELLGGKRRILDVALDVGFESASAFHEGFLARFSLPPGAYRKLARASGFELVLPADYRREDAFGMFGRDEDGRTERVNGSVATKALLLDGEPCLLELRFARGRVRASVHGARPPSPAAMAQAHEAARRMLGLGVDPKPFERRMRRARGLGRLVQGRSGLRIPLTADAFEGLVWVVVGQQVNVTFAATCRARLIELAGRRVPVGDGFRVHPTPAEVARVDRADLEALQFSRRKAEYVLDTARSIAAGELDLEGLRRAPAGRTEETLGAVRGLGPWSVNYLLMRSFGLEDCVPVGDVALVQALQNFFALGERPDARRTVELMEAFAPFRSLATFHLWRTFSQDTRGRGDTR